MPGTPAADTWIAVPADAGRAAPRPGVLGETPQPALGLPLPAFESCPCCAAAGHGGRGLWVQLSLSEG